MKGEKILRDEISGIVDNNYSLSFGSSGHLKYNLGKMKGLVLDAVKRNWPRKDKLTLEEVARLSKLGEKDGLNPPIRGDCEVCMVEYDKEVYDWRGHYSEMGYYERSCPNCSYSAEYGKEIGESIDRSLGAKVDLEGKIIFDVEKVVQSIFSRLNKIWPKEDHD